MSGEFYKISFCTTAMGRLDHLSTTLLQNIQSNRDYPNLEFVLLNYNSKDALEEWVKDNAMEHIESGRLVYLREYYAEHYNASHSKNVVSLASTGEVICNMDADNFAPEGYAFHINELMHRHPKAFVSFKRKNNGEMGRIAMFRGDFISVRGYNEAMRGWGGEDVELRARLVVLGCRRYVPDEKYATCISHSHKRRTENMPPGFRNIRETNKLGRKKSVHNLVNRISTANEMSDWGRANVRKNFGEMISIGRE